MRRIQRKTLTADFFGNVISAKAEELVDHEDGTIEETCENLAEGFDFFIKNLQEDGLTREDCTEIQQSLQACQNESVAEATEPKRMLTMMK